MTGLYFYLLLIGANCIDFENTLILASDSTPSRLIGLFPVDKVIFIDRNFIQEKIEVILFIHHHNLKPL